MKIQYKLLGKKRHIIRTLSREAYLKYPDNPEAAIEKVTTEIKMGSFISTILIALAVKLAVELIWYWVKKQYFVPSAFYIKDEPGY